MTPTEFQASLAHSAPPPGLTPALSALWWDGKGDWARGHDLINELHTQDAMAVHAYLHRKDGDEWNADYWYERSSSRFRRPALEAEWRALVEALLAG